MSRFLAILGTFIALFAGAVLVGAELATRWSQ